MLHSLKNSTAWNEGEGLTLRQTEQLLPYKAYRKAMHYENKIFGGLCFFSYELQSLRYLNLTYGNVTDWYPIPASKSTRLLRRVRWRSWFWLRWRTRSAANSSSYWSGMHFYNKAVIQLINICRALKGDFAAVPKQFTLTPIFPLSFGYSCGISHTCSTGQQHIGLG